MRSDPIFILAPTWRCGSTYVQRVLNAARDSHTGEPPVIWGESGGLVARFAEGIGALEGQLKIGGRKEREAFFAKNQRNAWTAAMSPPRDLVVKVLGEALSRIYAHANWRWGFKEIRYGERETKLLLEMFPKAKFVFVVRDIREAIRSYLTLGWDKGTPYGLPKGTPEVMAKAWRQHVPFFINFSRQHPRTAILTRQEDASEEECHKILSHVGLEWSEDSIQKVVQKGVHRLAKKKELSREVEKMVLDACGSTLRQLYPNLQA